MRVKPTHRIEEALVARRRVRGAAGWRQPLLPELAAQLDGLAPAPDTSATVPALGGAPRGGGAGEDWEARCFREACRYGREVAAGDLAAQEAALHARRPGGYVVVGWRERTLVTRLGEVRVLRRLYRA